MQTATCWFLLFEKYPLIVPLNFSGSKLNTASSGVRHAICWFFLREGCSSTPSLAVSSRGLAASSVLLKPYFGILRGSPNVTILIFSMIRLNEIVEEYSEPKWISWWITWFLRDGLKYFGISPLFGEDFHMFISIIVIMDWKHHLSTTYFFMGAVFDRFVALSSCCCPEGYPSIWRAEVGQRIMTVSDIWWESFFANWPLN